MTLSPILVHIIHIVILCFIWIPRPKTEDLPLNFDLTTNDYVIEAYRKRQMDNFVRKWNEQTLRK
jgi:hypothetical protein